MLIHNAATTRFIPFPDLEAVDEEIWDELFAVNTRAAFFLARAAAPLLRQSGERANHHDQFHCGDRHTWEQPALLCFQSRIDPPHEMPGGGPCAGDPGQFRGSRLAHHALGGRVLGGALEGMSERALLKKPTDLTDVAAAFVMLAKNTSMTGQVIVVDAGLMAS